MNTIHYQSAYFRHLAQSFWAVVKTVALTLTLAFALFLNTKAQVDLYIGGDIVLSGISDTLYAQGNIIYNAGAGKMNAVVNSAIYFTNNFQNNNFSQLPFYVDLNPLLRSRGAVIADQGFPQVIGGVGKINFFSLEIAKVLNTQKVDLSNQITVFNKLKMVNGDLNVGDFSVVFNNKDTASTIIGENDLNRIFGANGYLQVKRYANSSLISPANIGLTFNNLQDSVLVRRYFKSQTNAADGSIERYYEIRNSNGSIAGAFGQSVYLDSTEINGYGQEENLRLFRSTDDGATWNVVTSSVDTVQNKVTANIIQGITTDTIRYTIADFDCANPPIDSLGADTSFCQGDSVLLNAGTGSGWSYLWSTGDTTQTIYASQSDSIWLEIADQSGCITRDTIVVTEFGLPFVSLGFGQDTVSACAASVLTLDAGNPGSTFLWSNAATTQLSNFLHNDTIVGFDTIWVVVTDTNGCANNDSVIFMRTPSPIVNLGNTRNICGGSNLSLNAALPGHAGNTGPSYAWNTGASLASITVGSTGQYQVTVSNIYGCQTADTVQVNVAPSISATATSTNITCNGAGNGTVSLTVSGGTPPFNYLWSNGATTQNLSGLGPNTYNVSITDALGCTAITGIAVTQPPVLAHTMSGVNVDCNGAANGSATVNVSGGTAPYSYAWSNGGLTSTITNLGPGTYTVTVSDANGCSFSDSRIITQPLPLTINLNAQQNVSCGGGNNGQIDINVTGGTTAYNYAWSNGATSQDISGLVAGTYSVTVTDAHACISNASFTISEPNPIVLSATHLDASCNGTATGSIDLTVSGGTPGFNYQWSNGATSQDLSAIPAGQFIVTVTDLNNCTATLNQTVAQPTALLITTRTYDAACGQSNGAVVAQVSGGTPSYTYNWPSLGSSADSVSGVLAGIYQVFVTDGNGCLDSASAAVSNAGAPILTLDSATNVLCNGASTASIALSISGGVAPFTYLWSNGDTTLDLTNLGAGTYDLTVTAFDGCQAYFSQLITQPASLSANGIVTNVACFGASNGQINFIPAGGTMPYSYLWSNSTTLEDPLALVAGQYSVILTDGNGCVLHDTFTVNEPSEIVLSQILTNVSCGGGNDGAVDLSVSGGTPNYSYAWSSGNVSQDLTGIIAGTYYVTVTDQMGCIALDTAVISESSPITLALDSTDVQCNGGNDGALDLTVNGGTLPYAFLWNNGATTEDINLLGPGNYSVSITDSLGCTANIASVINEPLLLTVSLSATDVHCGGNANATAIALANGGTGAYHYNWSNGDTTSSIIDLAAGNYSLTLTDDHGCTVNGSVTVIEPPTLSFAESVIDVTCRDQSDGSILVTAFGGSEPYSYLWNTGATTKDLIAIPAGDYVLTLTDSAGCTFADTITVNQGDSALVARFLMATVVNSEDTVYFLEFSTPAPPFVEWDFGDGSKDSTSYTWHIYADNPNVDTSYYLVRLAVENAWCTDTLIKQITVVNGSGKVPGSAGSNGIGDILNLAVWPNPNMGIFHLNLDLRKEMDAKVQIIDLHGRLVMQRELTGDKRYELDFNLDDRVAAGVYLVNIQANQSQKIVRIVKF